MSYDAELQQWVPGLLWLGAWPVAGGLSQALLQGEAWLPVCAFKALTGCPCPLCGGTHLVHALAQGDWSGAWQAQPGLLPLLLGGWLWLGWRSLTLQGGRQAWSRQERWLLGAGVVFWLADWAWRVGCGLTGACLAGG